MGDGTGARVWECQRFALVPGLREGAGALPVAQALRQCSWERLPSQISPCFGHRSASCDCAGVLYRPGRLTDFQLIAPRALLLLLPRKRLGCALIAQSSQHAHHFCIRCPA